MSTQHQPGEQRWCAVCLEYVVYSPADYTCVVCESQKPCPNQAATPLPWSRAVNR